jgi:hypothetical protein
MTRCYFRTFVFVLLAVAGPASPAHAATYDLDFTGTISKNSVDALGLFGKAGRSLTGDSFTAIFAYSFPTATYTVLSQDVYVQPATYSLTVNNMTVTPASFGPITFSEINAGTSNGLGSAYGGITATVGTQRGATGASGTVNTMLELSLLSNILYPNGTQPNLLAPFAYTRQPGDTQGTQTQFSIHGGNSKSDVPGENVNLNINSVALTKVSHHHIHIAHAHHHVAFAHHVAFVHHATHTHVAHIPARGHHHG